MNHQDIWYDQKELTAVGVKVSRAVEEVLPEDLYCRTVVSVPVRHDTRCNYADVVVELEDGYFKREDWSKYKTYLKHLFHTFEGAYPGVICNFTYQDNAKRIILDNEKRFKHPADHDPNHPSKLVIFKPS